MNMTITAIVTIQAKRKAERFCFFFIFFFIFFQSINAKGMAKGEGGEARQTIALKTCCNINKQNKTKQVQFFLLFLVMCPV